MLFAIALVGVACRAVPAAPTAPVDDSTDVSGLDWERQWARTVAAAEREKLVLATHPGARYQQFVKAFRDAFPRIKVEHTGTRPSELSPRVIAEQRNGQFLWDVMVARASTMVEVLTPAGVFQEIRPFFLHPESTDDRYWYGGFELYAQDISKEPLTLIHSLDRTRGIWVNRDSLPETELTSVDDLLKPQLLGRIVVSDPSVPGAGSIALATILQAKGEDFVRQLLVEQKPVYLNDPSMVTTWVAEGRYPVGLGMDTSRLEQLKAAGVGRNVKELRPAEGWTLLASGASVFRNAPHPHATRVFLNWLWSREGQTAWSRAAELNSRRADVPPFDADTLPDYEQLERYSLHGTQQGSEPLNRVLALYRSIR
jgi:iron(III) transport system substrate-binding protein